MSETAADMTTATAPVMYISAGRLKQLEYIEKNYSTLVALGVAKVIALEQAARVEDERTDTSASDVDVEEAESDYGDEEEGDEDEEDLDEEEEEERDEEGEEEARRDEDTEERPLEVKTPPAKPTVSDSFLLKLSLESLIDSVRSTATNANAGACSDPLDI
jgi:hypothetical protein